MSVLFIALLDVWSVRQDESESRKKLRIFSV